MELRQSRYFVAIVQRGSIIRASLRCGHAVVEEG
jgi:DNA-binding transcriptional LysR family regulator